MPLDTLDAAAGQDRVVPEMVDKVNDTIDKVNEIDLHIAGGTTGQILQKTSNTDYDYVWTTKVVPSSGQSIFSGTQAITGSYANISSLSYVTPNDAISRTYMITGEAVVSINSATGDNQVDFQIYNSTDATALRSGSIAFPDVGGASTAKIQINIPYVGAPGINKTIVLRIKRPTSNGSNVITASITAIEVSR